VIIKETITIVLPCLLSGLKKDIEKGIRIKIKKKKGSADDPEQDDSARYLKTSRNVERSGKKLKRMDCGMKEKI
jgi:hypothetical protein